MARNGAYKVPPEDDPRGYDYSRPILECDVVMKGGITSGVIYPWLVCELAKTYRLRSIGGASAGAIAAGAAAAAELGREPTGGEDGGYTKMAALPPWFGEPKGARRTNLYRLFHPLPSTRALFDVFASGLGKKGVGAWTARIWVALVALWAHALLGAAAGVALTAAVLGLSGAVVAGPRALLLYAPGALVGAAVVVGGTLLHRLRVAVPQNGFGMCKGMAEDGRDGVSLTEWLSHTINDLAGLPLGGRPLTFGDLWDGSLRPARAVPRSAQADLPSAATAAPESFSDPRIRLQMMTTNLTHGRPYQVPFENSHFFFDPIQLRRWFPGEVVSWMEAHGPLRPGEDRDSFAFDVLCRQAAAAGLLPLPAAEHVPVILGVRLSLSFPLLLSAVPLYAIDWTRRQNGVAACNLEAWRKSHDEHADGAAQAAADALGATVLRIGDAPKPYDGQGPGVDSPRGPEFEVNWFSDGGICSNFPLHLFDAPLPSRPTFAINLRPFHPDAKKQYEEPENSVLIGHDDLHADDRSGIMLWWNRFASGGWGRMFGFANSIVFSAMNWVDNAQIPEAGYRERIVHVSVDDDAEGGLHLNMDPDTITNIAARGLYAGRKLTEQFAGKPASPEAGEGWREHRWIRYRVAMAAMDEWLSGLADKCGEPDTSCSPAWRRVIGTSAQFPPPCNPWSPGVSIDPATGHRYVEEETDHLLALAGRWRRLENDFTAAAPKNRPHMRMVPK